jgi:uncharacterized protein (DUF2336 family)
MPGIMTSMLNASSSTPLPEDTTDAVPTGEDAAVTLFDDLAVIPPPSPSRQVLMRRLADVVCLPESRINAFERAVTADLLVEMLRESDLAERARVAKRLSILAELPNSLVRLLLIDEVEVARPLIEEGEALSDSDLYYCARHGKTGHRLMLAARKGLSSLLSEILVESEEIAVIEVLLKNGKATLSQQAIETVVAMSQNAPSLVPLVMRRPEIRPSSAYVLFWWSPAEVRKVILSRFGVNREVMQDMAADVFAMAAKEKWQDAMSRKALQFIERRQRNREALKKSPYDSLEAAIADAAKGGMTRKMAEEIAYMSGIKPSTGAKLLRDAGGEGLAVLCKATGLSRKALKALWKALRRPLRTADGHIHPQLADVLIVYDMLAVDRAQTVLRYWNWSLSSALTHVMLKSLARGEDMELEGLSVPQRAAMLAFAQDLKS